MAPVPKPPSERLRRNKRNDVGLISADSLISELPDLPTRLGGVRPLKATKEAWERLRNSPHIVSLIQTESDLTALLRYATVLDERERALRAFQAERYIELDDGRVIINPAHKIWTGADKELRALEDRFGGSLIARMRLGIEWADASKKVSEVKRLNDLASADDDLPDDVIDINSKSG